MLRPICGEELTHAVSRLCGRRLYLHIEVTPGGFMRNLVADVVEAVLRPDDGPTYRLALRLADDGWVVMEGLTHMALREGEPLFLCTLAGEERVTRLIQVSEEGFAA